MTMTRHPLAVPDADPALRWMVEWTRWAGAMATVLPLVMVSPFFLAPPLWIIALMQHRRDP